MSTRAGVIGLGIMGGAFAKHLVAADVRTSGYDLLAANVEASSAHGGHACKSSREVAEEADIVITSLPHSRLSKMRSSDLMAWWRPAERAYW